MLTRSEVAAAFGVCETTVSKLVSGGHLRAITIGRKIQFPISEIERFEREYLGKKISIGK